MLLKRILITSACCRVVSQLTIRACYKSYSCKRYPPPEMNITNLDFPVWALLPKKETGVTNFLNRYPEYDGRGVIIGIFDSGVDPGAKGLQVTTDGKTKVIGRFDCSGAGDVDTSTVVQAKDGTITGLTGRVLKIPQNWNNPSGNYHIGFKNGYDLYPKTLLDRISKERREKIWDPKWKEALAEANSQLFEINKNNESLKTRHDKLKKEDLESQVECLTQLDKKYSDNGPTYDCIVFHDGESWSACIDTTENGDLEKCPVLKDYSKSYQFETLGSSDLLSYSVNIYDEGNLLEVVSVSSGHGTHVASIAAAHFPDEPAKNGIAPGAQIISYSIGDARLDTMETGTAIIRAMIKVMESRSTDTPVDVINMSYGEHSHWSCTGRVGELMNEVVDKYGVCWVAAAGNHGPALATIGTPPNISTNNIIGVGAYVSPEMMTAEYSLRQKSPGLPYTWSSRGPTLDGGRGVTICAPGGAITSVPQYTLCQAQLLNGTSMASPHVAGAVAVLLSGMKNRKLTYSPYSVVQALTNTAQYMSDLDHFAQGHGLLQVEKAFEHLVNYCGEIHRRVRFHVTCGNGSQKGIHMRSSICDKARDIAVTIEPVFLNADKLDPKEKLDFQMSLALSCGEPWISVPDHVEMTNTTRTIQVRVDPRGLQEGAHYTTIKAYDVKCPDKGPVFHFEVTVIKPVTFFGEGYIRPTLNFQKVFQAGVVQRHFILVPDKVSYAVVNMRLDDDKTSNFILHAVQLIPKKACKALEYHKMVSMSPHCEMNVPIKVKGGLIMELAVAKTWMDPEPAGLEVNIAFQGCRPDADNLVMHHGEGVMTFEVVGGLQAEEILPSIQLRHNVSMLKAVESKINPLTSPRDTIPPSRHIYQLIITYNLHVPKQSDITPNCGLLSDLLYENEFESQLWMLFDSNKQLMASGDAYPCKYTVKLDKGDYVIKLQIRHDKRELLEKISEFPMLVATKLSSPINLEVYPSHSNALVYGKKVSGGTVPSGLFRLPLYVAPLQAEKSIKNVSVGQYLMGTLTLSKNELGKKVDSYNFKYIVADLSSKKNSSANKAEKTKWEEYQDALRDLKTNWLGKLDKADDCLRLYEALKSEFPSHLAVHTTMVSSLEPEAKRPYPDTADTKESMETVTQIIKLTSIVCDAVNQEELLIHFGIKSDQRVDAPTIKVSMERQKNTLVEALCRKGAAVCRAYLYQEQNEPGDPELKITLEQIDDLWQNVLKYTEPTDFKTVGYFGIWHAVTHKNYGRAFKYASKLYEEKSTKELEMFMGWAANKLGWEFLAQHISRTTITRFPPAYRLF